MRVQWRYRKIWRLGYLWNDWRKGFLKEGLWSTASNAAKKSSKIKVKNWPLHLTRWDSLVGMKIRLKRFEVRVNIKTSGGCFRIKERKVIWMWITGAFFNFKMADITPCLYTIGYGPAKKKILIMQGICRSKLGENSFQEGQVGWDLEHKVLALERSTDSSSLPWLIHISFQT